MLTTQSEIVEFDLEDELPIVDLAATGKGLYQLQKLIFLVGQGFQMDFDLHSHQP